MNNWLNNQYAGVILRQESISKMVESQDHLIPEIKDSDTICATLYDIVNISSYSTCKDCNKSPNNCKCMKRNFEEKYSLSFILYTEDYTKYQIEVYRKTISKYENVIQSLTHGKNEKIYENLSHLLFKKLNIKYFTSDDKKNIATEVTLL